LLELFHRPRLNASSFWKHWLFLLTCNMRSAYFGRALFCSHLKGKEEFKWTGALFELFCRWRSLSFLRSEGGILSSSHPWPS
jgi:hypothetical protein